MNGGYFLKFNPNRRVKKTPWKLTQSVFNMSRRKKTHQATRYDLVITNPYEKYKGLFSSSLKKVNLEGKNVQNSIQDQIYADTTDNFTSTQQLILLALARFCRPGECRAYRSIDDLAKDTKLSRRCVIYNLKILKEKGILIPLTRHYGFQTKSVIYMINANKINNGERVYTGSASHAPQPEHKAPELVRKPDLASAPRAPHYEYNDYIYNTHKTKIDSQALHSEIKSFYKKEFEEWWDAYPRKENKQDAFVAFCNARKHASFENLLYKAKSYANQRARLIRSARGRDYNTTQDLYTYLPTTWFEKRGWISQYGYDEVARPAARASMEGLKAA